MQLFEVGGCVRDSLLDVESKDIDFAVVAESFNAMRNEMENRGFRVFQSCPEFLTIRAKFPSTNLVADFVLCRKESGFSNGRHPDLVEPGTILDDLQRRDFTVNAIARDCESGQLLDPHGGIADLLENRRLRAVGDASERFNEDALRVLRALRFSITKKLSIDEQIWRAFQTVDPNLLAAVSSERKQQELNKMFKAGSLQAMRLLNKLPEQLQEAIFANSNLWLKATLEK